MDEQKRSSEGLRYEQTQTTGIQSIGDTDLPCVCAELEEIAKHLTAIFAAML